MKRPEFDLFLAGLQPNDAEALNLLYQELDQRLAHRWRIVDTVNEARLVIFAPETEAGRQALRSSIGKKQAFFVPFYADEHAESDSKSVYKLCSPVRGSSLMLLLDRIGRDVAALDRPPEATADGKSFDELFTRPFGRTLLEALQDALAKKSSGGLRIDLAGAATVIVDGGRSKIASIGNPPTLRLWHVTQPVSIKELSADAIRRLEESGLKFGSATRHLWSIGMAIDTMLLPAVERDGVLRLKRYPNLPALDHGPEHRAICTALLTHASMLSELVETYGERAAIQTCNACSLIGLLHVSRAESRKESVHETAFAAARSETPSDDGITAEPGGADLSSARRTEKPKRLHLYSLIRSRLGLR